MLRNITRSHKQIFVKEINIDDQTKKFNVIK